MTPDSFCSWFDDIGVLYLYDMRLDGEQLVIETLTEGRVAADAGDIGGGDGLTSVYRNLDASELPITMGKWATGDVLSGLRAIVDGQLKVAGYLDANIAEGYLLQLGLSSAQ